MGDWVIFLRQIIDLLQSKVFYIKQYAINGMMDFVEDRCSAKLVPR